MLYSELVDVYEKIESTTKRLEMTDLLVEFLEKASKKSMDKIVYLTQGKLYPDYIGIEIGIAEKLAVKALQSIVGLRGTIVEGAVKEVGDMGEAFEKLLAKKIQSTLFKKPLTVDIVYNSFDKMAKATGSGSIETKIRYLSSLLNDASPKEAKYLIRTALGKLRLGVADMTILDALSLAFGGGKGSREHLERAYNLSSDLGLVAKTVSEGGLDAITNFKVKVGRPIRPMLSERLTTATEILEKMEGKAALEYKYDGIRIQAHITSKSILLFSRRLENITEQFPDACEYLKNASLMKTGIVEGECVAYNPDTGDLQPFQVISQRRGRKYDIKRMRKEVPIKVFLFDLLYSDRIDLTQKTYPERRSMLEKKIQKTDHVDISHQLISSNPAEIDRYMDQAILDGCEGIIAKSLGATSIYQAGSRGWIWIKYKRSYKAEIADTFDLVPIGGFKGRGRRAGYYGALLMAAYNKDTDSFETLCKLGSGFTDEDLAELPKRIGSSILKIKHARIQSLMDTDVWFTPHLVLEVAADEITLSPLHTCGRGTVKKDAGFALRFPRFTGNYRLDKTPEDATTTSEIIEIYEHQLKRIDSQ